MTPANIIRIVQGCALLLVLGLAYWLGGQGARADLAEYKTTVAKQAAHVADLATKASELARKAEQANAAKLAAIAQTHEDTLRDIEKRSEDRIAGLESGTLRIRKLWAGCETSRLSDPIARAAELTGQDRLRRESSERIVRAVERVQAQRDGLQAVVRADRD